MPDATFATATHGSQLRPVYLDRQMKVYPVNESDFEVLEVYAATITIGIALITLVAGFALTIWWDWFTTAIPGSPKESYGMAVLIICAAVVLGSGAVVKIAWGKKESVRARIERDSYVPMP